jgi:chromosome segregation ATPase
MDDNGRKEDAANRRLEHIRKEGLRMEDERTDNKGMESQTEEKQPETSALKRALELSVMLAHAEQSLDEKEKEIQRLLSEVESLEDRNTDLVKKYYDASMAWQKSLDNASRLSRERGELSKEIETLKKENATLRVKAEAFLEALRVLRK